MFKTAIITAPASSGTPVELTASINTDQEFVLHVRVSPYGRAGTGVGVYVGDSTVASGGGYLLTPAPASIGAGDPPPLANWSPETTLRLSGQKVYAITNSSVALEVAVIAYSV